MAVKRKKSLREPCFALHFPHFTLSGLCQRRRKCQALSSGSKGETNVCILLSNYSPLQSNKMGVQHYLVFCLPALPAWTQDAWASSCDRGKKWRRELEEGWARELTSYCRPGFLCLVSTRTQLLRWWPIGFPPIGYWRETTKFTQNLTCPCWKNWCAGTRGQFHAFSSLAGRVSKKEHLRMNLSPICAQPGFKYCYQREFYQNWSRRLRDECKNSSTVFKL